jgi:ABC-type phosphate transport system substrate-binding protein
MGRANRFGRDERQAENQQTRIRGMDMKFSIAGATFLLVGASAAAVYAGTDTNGDGLVLNGSDTLFEVTTDILTQCGGTITAGNLTGHGITYQGGGSGVGEAQMQNDNQEISPMSRALNNVFCAKNVTVGATVTDVTNTAQDLMIGLDGVAVVANTASSCAGNGVARTNSFPVTAGGDGVTPPTSCPGCTGSNYTIANSLDALKIIYGGRTSDGTVNCASDVRKSLVKQWHQIFTNTSCGSTTCNSRGLTHAWRRSDLSGTTDAFQGLTGLKTGAFAIGTLPLCTGGKTKGCVPAAASATLNPFCNAADINVSPMVPSNGGKGDYSDKDPIRTPCGTRDNVCETDGTLGLVLPIVQGDTTIVTDSDNYPTHACDPGSFDLQDNTLNLPCPGGPTFLGECFQPYYIDGTGAQNFSCFTSASAAAFGTDSGVDGRVWNLAIKKNDGQGHLAAYLKDANLNVMQGSFFRIHQSTIANYATAGTPTCTANNDTQQIGCLVNADPCSIGYAGREAVPTSSPLNQALLVNGIAPTNANIAKLLSDPTNVYPLSRRLFFASLVGFDHLHTASGGAGGGELEMSKCFGNNPGIASILSAHNFVPLVPSVDPTFAGVKCLNPGATGGPAACTLNASGGAATNTNCSTLPASIINGSVTGL